MPERMRGGLIYRGEADMFLKDVGMAAAEAASKAFRKKIRRRINRFLRKSTGKDAY
jgi:hypothetical protein